MTQSRTRPINLLIVEDEPEIRSDIAEQFELVYADVINVYLAGDAGKALDILRTIEIDAIILDIVMPYGTAENELQGDSDPDEVDTGLRLLQTIRSDNSAKEPQIWVAVTTARSNPHLLEKFNQLIEDNGKIFLKPFDSNLLEYYLCDFFKIEFRGLKILLPKEVLERDKKNSINGK